MMASFYLLERKKDRIMLALYALLVGIAAHGDNFAAKRMRKLTQRRAVDYTSTVVRYMQVNSSDPSHICYEHYGF